MVLLPSPTFPSLRTTFNAAIVCHHVRSVFGQHSILVPHCQAGSCLAVWRAVCDLVGKAMDPQWSALAEGEPATDGPVTGSTGSTGSDTRMRGIRRRNHFKKVAEDMLHEGDSQLQKYLRHNL